MSNCHQKIFIIIVLTLLFLPLTYLFGVSDDHVRIYGQETITELPSIHEQSFKEKQFQRAFEAWWNSHFAFRRLMLKAKNQIYDWANLGVIHSGASHSIVEGKNGYLFGKHYFNSFVKGCEDIPIETQIQKITELHNILKKRQIDLFIVLAPNKAVTYPDFIPDRYRYFLRKNWNIYNRIEKQLQDHGINVFNAQNLAISIRKNERYQPFSITGLHWNHYAAGRTVQEIAKKFHWGKVEIRDIESADRPYITERDLADLLNLFVKYNPKQKFYKPVFKKCRPMEGATTIIGNSFSNEFEVNFKESGLSDDLHRFENAPLVDENIADILSSKRVILVYTDLDLANMGSQLYKKIDFLIDKLKYVVRHKFSDALPHNLQVTGLSGIENWGRWSDGYYVNFDISKLPAQDLEVEFDMYAFLSQKRTFQIAKVFVNGKYLQTLDYRYGENHAPKLKFKLSKSAIIKNNGKLTVSFSIEDPTSPKELGISEDTRRLGIGFKGLLISDCAAHEP